MEKEMATHSSVLVCRVPGMGACKDLAAAAEGLITYIKKNIFIWLSRVLVAGIISLRCTASLVAQGL